MWWGALAPQYETHTVIKVSFMKFIKNNQPDSKAVESQQRHNQKERRNFLDMVGKAGIASSTLRYSSLLGGVMTARYAQAADSPKRVVFCYLNSGAPANDFRPSSATNMAGGSYHFGPQSHNVAGVCKFRGVDTEKNVHSSARQALGGVKFGVNTIDADLGSALGATSFYSSIFLGTNATPGGTDSAIIISSAGLPIEKPTEAAKKFFGAPPSVGNDDTFKKSFEAQKAAIASVKQKLSTEEQERLSKHLSALETLEARVTAQNSASAVDLSSCEPNLSADPDKGNIPGMVNHAKAQADVIVAAFACDITRVAVLQVGNHQGQGWVYKGYDGHGAGHSGGASIWNAMMTDLFEIPAYFIKKLSQTNDSNGRPLIESTAFCHVSCGGNGLSHNSTDAPFLLATKLPEFGGGGFSAKGTSATARNFFSEVAQGLGVDPSSTAVGSAGGNVDLLG